MQGTLEGCRVGALLALAAWGAVSCGSETIDLLPAGAPPSLGSGANDAAAGGASGSASESSGGPSVGGNEPCRGSSCPPPGGGGDGDSGLGCANRPECWQCESDRDCSGSTPHCAGLLGNLCVECTEGSHCGHGYECDRLAGRCADKCRDSDDCRSEAHVCDEQQGFCVECLNDVDCSQDGDLRTRRCAGRYCVGCLEHSDCAATSRPFCVGLQCSECMADRNCGPYARCDLSRGRCEEN
jgi:hypothetical protein